MATSATAQSHSGLAGTYQQGLQQHLRWQRTFWVRAVHALWFEAGLILAAVPLAAWWLGINLLDALLLDLGIVLFFLPYTLVYNWL